MICDDVFNVVVLGHFHSVENWFCLKPHPLLF